MTIRHLTVKERILLHLFDYSRSVGDYEAPFEVTQAGMAEAVGIRVQNARNYLGPLLAEGLVDERKSYVLGKPKRHKVYFLTAKGKHRVVSQRNSLLKERIPYRRPGRPIKELPLSRVYQEERRGSSLLQLLAELKSEGYIAEEIEEEIEEPGTPDVARFSAEAPLVAQLYGRDRELERVQQLLTDYPTVVITGTAGVGKTTLASKVCDALRGERSIFWRRIRSWDTTFDLTTLLSEYLKTLGKEALYSHMTGSEAYEVSRIEEMLATDLQGVRGLLVFDDVHRASADARDFFTALLEDLKHQEGASALLLSRDMPEFLAQRGMIGEDSVVELVLGGLDRGSSRALLLNLGIEDAQAPPLLKAADGNPLLLNVLAMRGLGATPKAGRDTLEAYIAEDLEEKLVEGVVAWLSLEAEEVAEAGNPEHAIGLVESALMIETDATRRLSFLQRLGALRKLAGDFMGSTEAYREALSHTSEEALAARLHAEIASNYHLIWLLDEAEEEVRKGLQLLPPGPSRERAELMLRSAEVAEYKGDFDRALREVEAVMNWIPTSIRDASLEGWARGLRGLLYISHPGVYKPYRALEDCLASVKILEGTNDKRDLLFAHFRAGIAHQYRGKPDQALRHFDRSAALAGEMGDLPGRLRTLFAKAGCLLRSGSLDQAEELYRETFGLAKELHPRYRLIWHSLQLARLYWFQGRLKEAKESLEYFWEAGQELPDANEKIDYLNWLVRLSVLTGDLPAARTYLERAKDLSSRVRREPADIRIEWAEAVLHAAEGENEEAEASFSRALELAKAKSRGYESRGELLLEYGHFLTASGDARKARTIFLWARDELKMEGVKPLEHVAHGELGPPTA